MYRPWASAIGLQLVSSNTDTPSANGYLLTSLDTCFAPASLCTPDQLAIKQKMFADRHMSVSCSGHGDWPPC